MRQLYPLRKKQANPEDPEWVPRLEEFGGGETGNPPVMPRMGKKKRAPERDRQTQPQNTTPEQPPSNATDTTGMETSSKIYQGK